MDIVRSTVALRDRSLLDVLDLVIRFAARHFTKLALVSAITSLPGFAIVLLLREDVEPFALWPLALLFVVLAEIPVVALASRLVFDERATVREGLVLGLRSMGRVLGVRILQMFAILLSSLTVLLPLWVQGIFLFAPEAALLERASPIAALGRSQKLAGRSTAESILGATLSMVAGILAAPLGDYVGRTTMSQLFDATPPASIWEDPTSIFALAGFFAAGPMLALFRFFLYLNVRTRVEGWDVQTRFGAIAQRHELDRRLEAA
jgi:hypothetical protein